MRKVISFFFCSLLSMAASAQSLTSMQWFNEPEHWKVDGKYHLSCVVTHHTSDWSVIELDHPVDFVWIKAVRRLDAIEIFYSFDDKTYTLMRNCWMQDNTPVQIGLAAACPDGDGFTARFENFKVKHLPDQRRLDWLKANSGK